MTDSSARTTIFVGRLLSSLCFVAACTVVSAQEGGDATPNQAEIEHARQLIRETPCPGAQHNPVRVIRSVNCLHSLRKKQAISLLLEVASRDKGAIVIDPEGELDSVPVQVLERHDQRVCTIVPLLFDVPEEGTPPPDAWHCRETKKWVKAAGTQVIQGGIPVNISGEWTYGGRPYATRPLVEWTAKHGRLRTERLQPQDDPLQAADALYDRVASVGVIEFEVWWDRAARVTRDKLKENLRVDLRVQAISMLHNGMRDIKALPWDELRRTIAQLGIRWDSKSEMHTLKDSQTGG